MVAGNVNLDPAAETASKVMFEGSLSLVFGFHTASLVCQGERSHRFERLYDEAALDAVPAAGLRSEGPLVRLPDL